MGLSFLILLKLSIVSEQTGRRGVEAVRTFFGGGEFFRDLVRTSLWRAP